MTHHDLLAAMGGFHRFGGGPFLAVIVFLIVPAIVITLITYGLITLWHRGAPPVAMHGPGAYAPNVYAQGILDERFARGEIDADLYVRQSDLLRATRDGRPVSTNVAPPVSAASPVTPAGDDPEE